MKENVEKLHILIPPSSGFCLRFAKELNDMFLISHKLFEIQVDVEDCPNPDLG